MGHDFEFQGTSILESPRRLTGRFGFLHHDILNRRNNRSSFPGQLRCWYALLMNYGKTKLVTPMLTACHT